MMKKKVVVTGGAGFIGSHLVDALLAEKDEVHVIDDLSAGKKENVAPRANLHVADIASRKCAAILASIQPHEVFHLAAQKSVRMSVVDPISDAHVNIAGLVNVMEALRTCTLKPSMVYVSSGGAMYGDTNILPTPESHPARPESPYGISKYVGELYVQCYFKTYGIKFSVARLSNVYGPRQDPQGEAGVVAIFVSRALQGQPLEIYGSGEQTRDFVYVADVVDALMRCRKPQNRAFNIATGLEVTIDDLAKAVISLTNNASKIIKKMARPGEQFHSALATDFAKERLGYIPKYSLAAGLRATIDYFSRNA